MILDCTTCKSEGAKGKSVLTVGREKWTSRGRGVITLRASTTGRRSANRCSWTSICIF